MHTAPDYVEMSYIVISMLHVAGLAPLWLALSPFCRSASPLAVLLWSWVPPGELPMPLELPARGRWAAQTGSAGRNGASENHM